MLLPIFVAPNKQKQKKKEKIQKEYTKMPRKLSKTG
jgi:hypothetical protein